MLVRNSLPCNIWESIPYFISFIFLGKRLNCHQPKSGPNNVINMTKNIRIQKVLSYARIVTLVGDQNLNRPIFLFMWEVAWFFFVILKEKGSAAWLLPFSTCNSLKKQTIKSVNSNLVFGHPLMYLSRFKVRFHVDMVFYQRQLVTEKTFHWIQDA